MKHRSPVFVLFALVLFGCLQPDRQIRSDVDRILDELRRERYPRQAQPDTSAIEKRLGAIEAKLARRAEPPAKTDANAELRKEIAALRKAIEASAASPTRPRRLETRLEELTNQLTESEAAARRQRRSDFDKLESQMKAILDRLEKLEKKTTLPGIGRDVDSLRGRVDDSLDMLHAVDRKVASIEKAQRALIETTKGLSEAVATPSISIDKVATEVVKRTDNARATERKLAADRAAKLEAAITARLDTEDLRRQKAEEALTLRIDTLGTAVTELHRSVESSLQNRAARPPAEPRKTSEPGAAGDPWTSPWLLVPAGLALCVLLWMLFRREPAATVPEPERPRHEPEPAPQPEPARREAPPRVQSLRVPAERTANGSEEAVRGLLECDSRILVEPAPRVEQRADGSLSIRFYVHGKVEGHEANEISEACMALAARGS